MKQAAFRRVAGGQLRLPNLARLIRTNLGSILLTADGAGSVLDFFERHGGFGHCELSIGVERDPPAAKFGLPILATNDRPPPAQEHERKRAGHTRESSAARPDTPTNGTIAIADIVMPFRNQNAADREVHLLHLDRLPVHGGSPSWIIRIREHHHPIAGEIGR